MAIHFLFFFASNCFVYLATNHRSQVRRKGRKQRRRRAQHARGETRRVDTVSFIATQIGGKLIKVWWNSRSRGTRARTSQIKNKYSLEILAQNSKKKNRGRKLRAKETKSNPAQEIPEMQRNWVTKGWKKNSSKSNQIKFESKSSQDLYI